MEESATAVGPVKRLFALLLCLPGMAVGCDVVVPPFPDGQGQKAHPVTYPPGPYGVSKGQVATNYSFVGFYRPQADADPNHAQPIVLADFYNPTGSDVFPEGSPYGAGTPKPKALLLDIGATWCGPCQVEAKTTLPPKYGQYQPQGAEFLFLLADGAEPGVPGTAQNLSAWVTKFKTSWPSVIDPDRNVTFGSAYPINVLIDTTSMVIVDIVSGGLSESDPLFDELTQTLGK
jgi:hypothetical protein